MSSRFDNIQSRSIYVGASTNVDPTTGSVILDGNLGIGTTSPSAKIHVSAGDSSYALFGPNTTYGGSLRVGAGPASPSNTIAQVVASDGNLHLDSGTGQLTYINYYSSTNTLINPNAGNVGIGTYSPAVKLDVFRYSRVSEGSDYMQFGQWDGFTNRLEYVNRPFKIVGYSINSDIIFANNSDQERMRITTAGYIGINTSSPSGILDVNVGSANITTYSYGLDLTVNASGGGFARSNRQYEINNNTTSFFGSYGSTGAGVERAYWVIGNRASDVTGYTTANGIHLLAGGNVGIGTTSPQARLDVNGGDGTPQGSQFAAVIKGADSGNRTLYFDGATQASVWWGSGNTPQFAIDSISGGGANFWTNNGTDWSERMRIQSNGDIAINTTVASYKLDVNGWFGALRIYPYNTNSTYFAGDTGGITVNGPGYLYAASSGGSYFEGNVRIRGALSNDTAGYLQINGGTANLTYFAGTIGIGSTSIFHSASITSAGKIFLAHTNNSDIGGTIYGYWDSGYQAYAGGLVFQSFNIDGGGSYTMKDTMWLTGGGNLGIGTANAWFPASGRRILSINGVNSSLLEFQKNGVLSGYIYSTDSLLEISGGDSAYQTFLTSNAERMRITTVGNVGIGTSTPGSKLEVAGDIGIGSGKIYNNAANNSAGVGFDSSFVNLYGFYGIKFYASNAGIGSMAERMRITDSGNVGIGTSSPAAKLHVVGDMFGGSLFFSNANINSFGSAMTFTNNSAERMRISTTGNVGIGTPAPDPSALLDVASRRQGFLPPRMRNSDMIAIPSPAPGLIVFDVDNSKLTVYTGTGWVPLH